MPFRVVVALLLLYSYIGISVIVSLIAVILLFLITLVLIRKNKVFLFNIGKNQDLRIKATAVLFNAQVIKFQAWEQHFYGKIQSFRKEELAWISKYQFTFCGNLIMLWSILYPSFISFQIYPLTLCSPQQAIVSVERIKQFIKIPSEAEWTKPNSPLSLVSTTWPEYGYIEIKDLKVKYRENTPLVLKGMSLSINGGEKIGVVGRTGCGKSTLIQVFRLVEPFSGKIIIDGIDICKLGLHDLRSRLGIIPQEPVLFEGTIRSNLDPLGLYSDSEIWKCLEQCQLKVLVSSKPEKLDSSVVDSGENWSVGQRQLLCLGRVLLKRAKVLFMDEATASVDSKTDCEIQKIIRQHFSSSTIITIAHRIPTVMDCDKVLVMDDGNSKEFDSPSNLMSRASLFGALVQEYANRASH